MGHPSAVSIVQHRLIQTAQLLSTDRADRVTREVLYNYFAPPCPKLKATGLHRLGSRSSTTRLRRRARTSPATLARMDRLAHGQLNDHKRLLVMLSKPKQIQLDGRDHAATTSGTSSQAWHRLMKFLAAVPKAVFPQSVRIRRHSLGTTPFAVEKQRVKWLWSAKPQSIAIWPSESFDRSIISLARSNRLSMSHLFGDRPVVFLKALAKWLRESPLSRATSSSRMRPLRLAISTSFARRS